MINLGYYTPLTLPVLFTGGLAPFQHALARRSVDLLRLRPGENVLDAACGNGHTTRRIADHNCTVTGIDLHPGHIRKPPASTAPGRTSASPTAT